VALESRQSRFDETEGKLVLQEESGAIIHNWESPEEARIFEEIFVRTPPRFANQRRKQTAKPLVAK
jgi:hypothetical protein